MILSDRELSTATETVIPVGGGPSWWPACGRLTVSLQRLRGEPRASSPLAGRAISKRETREESAADSPEEGRGISRLATGLKHSSHCWTQAPPVSPHHLTPVVEAVSP